MWGRHFLRKPTMPFSSLGLSDPVVRAVAETGYTTPTEIQARAIPPAMEGRDVIGRAQTGTGKTAAFALPIIDRLINTPPPETGKSKDGKRSSRESSLPHVRALVLTPTRELAVQIEEAFQEYGRFTDLRTLTVYGGVPIDKQIRRLKSGIDVVIATPGRLLDHMNRGSVNLSKVEVFVLDETDRMFDMGFINDVRKIVRAIPGERQTLLFSATISMQVKSLASRLQTDAVLVEVGEERNPIDTITQHIYPTQSDRKLDLLRKILDEEKSEMVLVFSGTKDGADFVTRRLQHYGIDASQLHSNLTQRDRRRALEGFKSGEHRVLVATDIAARGIDVEGISLVVNYDVPRYAEDYIHRVGRTGRAEATGDAVTFVGYEEEEFLSKIETFIGLKFERETYRDFDHGVVKLIRDKNAPGRRRMPPRRRRR
jgi:ATP-dependent RNA helicase RhlE